MRLRHSLTALPGVIAAALCLGVAEAQVAHLTFNSEPGDFIGRGLSRDITYTPNNGEFFFAIVSRTSPSDAPAQLIFLLGTGATPSASLVFGTDQLGIPMQPGFYPDARRANLAPQGHPGLSVSFDGRGCNTLTGSFTVYDFTYSPSLGIQSFSASFEQHCEGALPALFGTFTFNVVPEPSTASLFTLCLPGAVGMLACGRHRRPIPKSPSGMTELALPIVGERASVTGLPHHADV